jgi:hypothetical protein
MAGDCKSPGVSLRWFESIRSHMIFALVAQLEEQEISTLLVVGSSPARGALEGSHNGIAAVY